MKSFSWPSDTPYQVAISLNKYLRLFHPKFDVFDNYLSCIFKKKFEQQMIFPQHSLLIQNPQKTITYIINYLETNHYFQHDWNLIIERTHQTKIFDSITFCNVYKQLFQIMMLLFKCSYQLLHKQKPFPRITAYNAFHVQSKPIWNIYMKEWYQTMPTPIQDTILRLLEESYRFHTEFCSTVTGIILR